MLKQWFLSCVCGGSWLLALSYPKCWCMLSYLVLVEVTVSLGSQGPAFRPWLPDLGRSSQALFIPLLNHRIYSLKSCFRSWPYLKGKSSSCMRGPGFDSAEVMSVGQEGGKEKGKVNQCYLPMHAVYGNHL